VVLNTYEYVLKIKSSCLFFCCFFVLFLWGSPSPCFSADQYKIFIVHSYDAHNVCGLPQETGILEGLAELGFTPGNNLLVERFYMDTKRVHTTSRQMTMQGRTALAVIKKWQPDVVVTLDDNATREVMLPLVGSEIPVVFSGINNTPEYYNGQQQFMNNRKAPGYNVTGVYEKLHVAKSLQVMKEIVPDLKRIVVLVDDSPTGHAIRKQAERELSGSGGNILYSFWLAHDFVEYKRMIQRINSDPAIGAYYPACSRLKNGTGSIVSVPEITAWTLAHCTKPAMAVNFSFSRLGVFGGASVNFLAMGRQAAGKIAAILNGGKAGDIPVEDAEDYALVFNLARARQLGVSIPADLLGAADQVYGTMEMGSPLMRPQVLIIHSEGIDGDEALLEQGIFHEMEASGWINGRTVDILRFFLHTEQVSSEEVLHERGNRALDVVYQLKPDVVVVLGDAAATEIMLPLVGSSYPVLFAGVHAPLSYYRQYNQMENGRLFPGKNTTGVSSTFDYVKTLEAVHLILPEARRMVVIISESWPWTEAIRDDFAAQVSSHHRELGLPDIRFERVSTLEEFKKMMLRFDADPEVEMINAMLPIRLTDTDGSIVSSGEILAWLFAHQHKPGFTFSASGVRHGFLVSASTNPERTGRQLGRQLVRVLAGDVPASISIERPVSSGLFLNQARARQLGVQIPVDIFEAAQHVYTTMDLVVE